MPTLVTPGQGIIGRSYYLTWSVKNVESGRLVMPLGVPLNPSAVVPKAVAGMVDEAAGLVFGTTREIQVEASTVTTTVYFLSAASGAEPLSPPTQTADGDMSMALTSTWSQELPPIKRPKRQPVRIKFGLQIYNLTRASIK